MHDLRFPPQQWRLCQGCAHSKHPNLGMVTQMCIPGMHDPSFMASFNEAAACGHVVMWQRAQQRTHRACGVGPSPTGEGLVGSLAGCIHISCSASCALQVGLPSAGVDDWQGLALLGIMELVVDEDLVAKEQATCQTPS